MMRKNILIIRTHHRKWPAQIDQLYALMLRLHYRTPIVGEKRFETVERSDYFTDVP